VSVNKIPAKIFLAPEMRAENASVCFSLSLLACQNSCQQHCSNNDVNYLSMLEEMADPVTMENSQQHQQQDPMELHKLMVNSTNIFYKA